MNWFAIGAGFAMIVVATVGYTSTARGSTRIPRSAAVALGLVGLLFMYLGGALEVVR